MTPEEHERRIHSAEWGMAVAAFAPLLVLLLGGCWGLIAHWLGWD